MRIERRAARVLLLAGGSVLLIKGFDPGNPDSGAWWLTPGGGVDDGESLDAGAVREVREETGLVLAPSDLGPVVATRTAEFEFDHGHFRQREWFFAVQVDDFVPGADGWDEIEQRALLEHRWWSVDELRDTEERIYPRELAELVVAVLDGRVPPPLALSGE